MRKGVLLVTSRKQADTCQVELGKLQDGWIVINTGGQITETSSDPVTILHDGEVEEHWRLREGKEKLISYLQKLSSDYALFILAADGSIESEKIANDLDHLVPESSMKITILKSLKGEDILESIENRRDIDPYHARAAAIRHIVDKLIGYKLGNIMNWHLRQSGYMIPSDLSIGRLMCPALRILSENQRNIDEHEKEEYVRLKCWYRKDKDHFEAIDKTRFFTESFEHMSQMKELRRKFTENPHVVLGYNNNQREEAPPEPLHHATLQEACNNHFKFKSEDTIRLAKELYEAGYISNYRTNSNQISEEVYEKVLVYLYATVPEDTIVDIKRRYKVKDGATEEESAIAPTIFSSELSPENIMHLWKDKREVHLSKDHRKVYSMIWYRTLATQIENAFFDSTELILEVLDHRIKLVTNKPLIRYDDEGEPQEVLGWLALNEPLLRGSITLADEVWLSDEVSIPEHEVGEVADCIDVTLFTSGTQPPKRYGEGRFIKTLKKLNIAQPSSLPALVKGMAEKGFIEHTGSVLMVRALGRRVNDWMERHVDFLYDTEQLIKISSTLKMIENGEHPEPEELIRKVYAEIQSIADTLGYDELQKNERPSQLQIEQARSIAREKRIVLGEKLFESREAIEVFLRNNGGEVCDDMQIETKEVLGRCPQCQKGSVIRKEKFYGCSHYVKNGCKFGLNIEYSLLFFERFGFKEMGMEYLDSIVSGALAKEYVEVKNMRSKNDAEFNGKVALVQKNGYWNIGFFSKTRRLTHSFP